LQGAGMDKTFQQFLKYLGLLDSKPVNEESKKRAAFIQNKIKKRFLKARQKVKK
jgi:hypothetical protein